MDEFKKVIFEPKVRIKMLRELVFPSIFRASWDKEDKVRALCRHKLRVAQSIKGIGDLQEQETLCNTLDELYSQYITLMGVSSIELDEGERAVEEEFEKLEIDAHARIPLRGGLEAEASATVKWIKARIGMLWAQVAKNVYLHHPFTQDELDQFKKELNRVERKLAGESNSQTKTEIAEAIELLRELLLCYSLYRE